MTDKKNPADRMNAEDGFRQGILSIIEAELSSKMREFGFFLIGYGQKPRKRVGARIARPYFTLRKIGSFSATKSSRSYRTAAWENKKITSRFRRP